MNGRLTFLLLLALPGCGSSKASGAAALAAYGMARASVATCMLRCHAAWTNQFLPI